MRHFQTYIFLAASMLLINVGPHANSEALQEGLVETKILDKDPQAGVKSHHFYYIDFDNQTVASSFATGSTNINLGIIEFDVESIRDNFKVSSVKFSDDAVAFTLEGTTASGVMVMPDIDYRLSFRVTKNGSVSVKGCHDAYPAYRIQHQGNDIYSFQHKSLDLIKLFGTCGKEIKVE